MGREVSIQQRERMHRGESSIPVLRIWGLGDRPSKSNQEGKGFKQQPLGDCRNLGTVVYSWRREV